MQARFPGKCTCGARFDAGAEVVYDSATRKITRCPACNPDAGARAPQAAEPGGGGTVVIRGRVQRVKWEDPISGRRILVLVADGDVPQDAPVLPGRPFDATGTFRFSTELGDLVEVRGTFSRHERYGWQMKVVTAIPVIGGTDQGLIAFLKRFPNVGEVRAAEMLRHFGGREATIAVLERDPSRLAEINGITAERATEIGKAFGAAGALRDSALFLSELHLAEGLTAQILDAYGARTRDALRENPYVIMELPGVGFKKADDVALRMGLKPDDPRRCAAAVLFVFAEYEDEGHTFADAADLDLPRARSENVDDGITC